MTTKIIGIGDSGVKIVNRMHAEGFNGLSYAVINTGDLTHAKARVRVQIGDLGTGGLVDHGRRAAEAHEDEIRAALRSAGRVFIVGGLGGGTATGAIPVVARWALNFVIPTNIIVTLPFPFEGPLREQTADLGLARLHDLPVETISGNSLFPLVRQNPTVQQIFGMLDGVVAWRVAAHLMHSA